MKILVGESNNCLLVFDPCLRTYRSEQTEAPLVAIPCNPGAKLRYPKLLNLRELLLILHQNRPRFLASVNNFSRRHCYPKHLWWGLCLHVSVSFQPEVALEVEVIYTLRSIFFLKSGKRETLKIKHH